MNKHLIAAGALALLAGSAIAAPATYNLDPTHTYRLLFQNVGSSITGEVVDVANPGTVLGTASATDSRDALIPTR